MALTTGATVVLVLWFADRRATAPVGRSTKERDRQQVSAQTAQNSARAARDIEALARVVERLHDTHTEDPAATPDGGIPTLPEESSPLLELTLGSPDPVVRDEAREVRRWLRVAIDVAIRPCWKEQPAIPIWAQFVGRLSATAQDRISIAELRVTSVRGLYQLSPEEERCIGAALSGVTELRQTEKQIAAIESVLPATEHIQFEWPCATCR